MSATVFGWVGLGLVVALLFPAERSANEAARRNSCLNNLKQITIGLLNYEADYGALPPAYTVDAQGNRLHSWRTLLLPYVEQADLYAQIDLSKPWDDPANAHVRQTPVDVFVCPSSPHDLYETMYVAVLGDNCAFRGAIPCKTTEITDKRQRTIAIIDADHKRAVHWMSPEDIRKEEVLQYGPHVHSHHPGLIAVAFLDGHVATLALDRPWKEHRAMFTFAGGK